MTAETWAHDYITAVNRLVADRGINNQNDIWHGIKNIKKKMKTVAQGPLYKRNKTWSLQLEDKVDAVANHNYWQVKIVTITQKSSNHI